ncbi:MAG: glycine dehydrogenase (aminomethyl-transferring) [Elusimicrobia bacterium CG08_land_8_20_14_0_20_51_18]|nr:MAG: glycine dehydrogenase (aminomethyl-transferring) [Elusimicrobia bacterium CG08_land_8_20_14_0_20_51_18]
MKFDNKLSIEKSGEGKRGFSFKKAAPKAGIPQGAARTTRPRLPELSEFDVVRHFTRLSKFNFSVDTHFYPLGSCTMKYNPKINEEVSSFDGFTHTHPLAMDACAQGTLEIIWDMEKRLCELCGMDAGTLWPVAGAHGEYTGILLAKKHFEELNRSRDVPSPVKNEEGTVPIHSDRVNRDEIIVPDSAHGTNPATASMAGFKTININSAPDGRIDLEVLKARITPKTAVIMLTVPNTLGIFESNIAKICEMAHANGSLVYMDGANFNALIGLVKPGELGVDIMHLNMHKTFSTPHGGGGPGAGGIMVKKALIPYLPAPRIEKKGGSFSVNEDLPLSIGRIKAWFTNTQVLLRAYAYLLMHGPKQLREIAENSIINANYIKSGLQDLFPPYSREYCMHECVLAPSKELTDKGIRTLDVAKRLLDYGYHAPTIYFPIIVHEAIMIEPTETESKETMDAFIAAMTKIHSEAQKDPEFVKKAPHTMPVKRLDEVEAARKPNIRW